MEAIFAKRPAQGQQSGSQNSNFLPTGPQGGGAMPALSQLLSLAGIGLLAASNFAFAKPQKWLPVVLIHGINNEPRDWTVFIQQVKALRPSCRLVDMKSPFDGIPGSWLALDMQKDWFLKHIAELQREEAFFDGFDLVCHSQGAVICNALAQEIDHGLKHFISLAGPQVGVYGAGFFHGVLPPIIRDTTVEDAYLIAYEHWAQALLSPANLWNDPHHQDLFMSTSQFLPVYLGLRGDAPSLARRKRNYLNLGLAAYLVGNFSNATFDQGIDPWHSGIFSFYSEKGVLVPMENLPFYVKDTFGLRSLRNSGRLVVRAVPNVLHDDWIFNEQVIRDIVIPLLSPKNIQWRGGGGGLEEATLQS